MTGGGESILMVSSHDSFAHSLKSLFDRNGYQVAISTTESSGVAASQRRQPSLVLVNRLSFDPASLRQHVTLRTIPILSFCPPGAAYTADDCAADLGRGADISVCNESARQLLARTRAVLRRLSYASNPARQYEIGGIRMDLERHEVTVRGQPIELTLKEFQILLQFMQSPNRVFSRQELLNKVWGEDYALEEHALDVHICSLRHKIEPSPSRPAYIITVRRVGFKFAAR